MRTFRLQLRFLVPLAAALVAAAYLALPLMDQLTGRWFARDLNMRGALIANTLSDTIQDALTEHKMARLQAIFERATKDERLVAIGLCGPEGNLLRSTSSFPRKLSCTQAQQLVQLPEPRLAMEGGAVLVGVHDIPGEAGPVKLVLLHDLSFTERRSQDTRPTCCCSSRPWA